MDRKNFQDFIIDQSKKGAARTWRYSLVLPDSHSIHLGAYFIRRRLPQYTVIIQVINRNLQ